MLLLEIKYAEIYLKNIDPYLIKRNGETSRLV